MRFCYFAYGSNLLTERLAARCPSTRVIGRAIGQGFRLDYSKRGHDGSGKATIWPDAAGAVEGVLFDIALSERPDLDRFEAVPHHYHRIDRFAVATPDGATRWATTYQAVEAHTDPMLVPFDWYRALVVAGARQHRLEPAYIQARLEGPSIPDPVPDRPTRLEAIRVLEAAGFADLLK